MAHAGGARGGGLVRLTAFDRLYPLPRRGQRSYRSCINATSYATEYDAIVAAMQGYIEGSRQGKSELMRPAFHPNATLIGYARGQLLEGTKLLFDWIDGNGPAPSIFTFRQVDSIHRQQLIFIQACED